MTFGRSLTSGEMQEWYRPKEMVNQVRLDEGRDEMI